jgi:histidinol-phosphate phosphatase family protein
MSGGRPAIFMDRDGTLSHEVGYVNHPSRLRLYPWTVAAVRAINRAGWLAVVVTNQAGVARGYFPESVFDEVQRKLQDAVEAGGGRFDAVYACTTRAWASRLSAPTATAASRAPACCARRKPSSART